MTTLVSTPIFIDREFYVPRFELFIGDSPERGALLHDVMQVSYKDSIEEIDTFELTINNWDAEKRRFKHHDSTKLNPGQRVRLYMGYLDDKDGMRLMVQGIITEMTPTFPASGQPVLKVVGQNVLNRFCKEPRSASYQKNEATASKVAAKICRQMGVEFRNDTTHKTDEVSHQHLIQDNQSDILFLLKLARAEGYDIVIEEPANKGPTVLKFERSGEKVRTVYELRYGATLTEFQPSLSTSKQVSSVTVSGWDVTKGESINVTVGQEALQSSQTLKSKLMPGTPNPVADRKDVLANEPVRDNQAAHAKAVARLATINQELVTGTGSVIGLPELRSGSQVYLWGLGRRFSGRYFITGTTHSLGMSGYTTQFECRLEELESDPHEEQQ